MSIVGQSNFLCFTGMMFLFGISSTLASHDYIENLYMPLIKTQNSFDYVIQKYPYVIAYVYTLPKGLAKPQQHIIDGREMVVYSQAYHDVNRIYELMQQNAQDNAFRYNAAGVKYIGVNRDKGDVKYVGERYKLDIHASYLLFFQHGKLATTYLLPHHFSSETLHAFLSQGNVEDFIADELATQARQATQKEEQEEREYKKRRRRYYSSYYNDGPVVGVGFGYGYSYPYYGGYWGAPYGGYWGGPYYAPGFGISFSV